VLGHTYNASMIVNLTNVDYVYSGDPRKNSAAVVYPELTWKAYKKVLGMSVFHPSAHAPFDPVASAFAERHKLTVTIANGANLANLEKLLEGKKFKGTVIKP